jgi:hypothetical protein
MPCAYVTALGRSRARHTVGGRRIEEFCRGIAGKRKPKVETDDAAAEPEAATWRTQGQRQISHIFQPSNRAGDVMRARGLLRTSVATWSLNTVRNYSLRDDHESRIGISSN